MLMNREQIKEVLPHREPFLLVDEVEEMEVGKSIVATKSVTEDEYYFQGHFPGRPIMPGVLIVESLAQAGGIAVLSHAGKQRQAGCLRIHQECQVQETGGSGRRSDFESDDGTSA